MFPILFKLGPVTVYTYGFFVALGVIVVLWLAVKRAKAFGFAPSAAADLVFFLFVAGVIGARFFFVAQHFEDYKANPLSAFSIQEGGLVWYGGFLFAVFAGIGYAVFRKWPVLKFCDFFTPFLPLAHAIGRLGCFFNGCCFGRITRSRWGVMFPGEPFARYPTQLYEAAFLFLLSFFLFYLSSKKHREGEIFVLYLVFYSGFRFLIEFLRGDQVLLSGLTLPQWTSLFLFLGAVSLFFFIRKKRMAH